MCQHRNPTRLLDKTYRPVWVECVLLDVGSPAGADKFFGKRLAEGFDHTCLHQGAGDVRTPGVSSASKRHHTIQSYRIAKLSESGNHPLSPNATTFAYACELLPEFPPGRVGPIRKEMHRLALI